MSDSGRLQFDKKKPPRRNVSGWDAVAEWYDGWMGKGGSIHHRKLAVPAVLRLLAARPDETVLDVGAGQGVLAPGVAQAGAAYTGVDVSTTLLDYARQHHGESGTFIQADAANLKATFPDVTFDAAVFLLSIQDMDPLDDVIRSTAAVLKPGGRVVLLMTHPAFRVPRQSGWGFDEGRKLQYRRVDRYLTPLPVPMKQHPGQSSGVTISFHRPLGEYINTLGANHLLVDRMDEIPVGDSGVKRNRSKAERLADEEFPLFLGVRARYLQPDAP
jgi:ubiquinone/menaquinone biosynthesis C-methylase UbiE